MKATLRDNGGRRSGIDPRQFSYTDHIPERRSGKDRRNEPERRNCSERRSGKDRRSFASSGEKKKVGAEIIDMRKHQERRVRQERRSAFG